MEISSNLSMTTSGTTANAATFKSAVTPTTNDAAGATATYASASTQPAQTDSVSLSGEAIMLSRLYGSEQAVPATPLVGMSQANVGANPVMWLTADDRNALSGMYAYAQQTGADLRYVDYVAFQLAYYRQTEGTPVSNWNDTPRYDNEGHRLTFYFNDEDAASAKAIQNNSSNTKLDQGFLNYILDPGYGQNHIMNFQFLEKYATRDAAADDANSLATEFGTFTVKQEQLSTASKGVEFRQEEPDTINDNGVFSITAKGVKDGFVMVNGQPVQADRTNSVQLKNGHVGLNIQKPSFTNMLLTMLKNVATSRSR